MSKLNKSHFFTSFSTKPYGITTHFDCLEETIHMYSDTTGFNAQITILSFEIIPLSGALATIQSDYSVSTGALNSKFLIKYYWLKCVAKY